MALRRDRRTPAQRVRAALAFERDYAGRSGCPIRPQKPTSGALCALSRGLEALYPAGSARRFEGECRR